MAEINSHMFREYDIRGIAGEDLNAREAELIGKAFGTYCKNSGEKTVLVARDARLSSPSLTAGLIAGITSTGVNVVDIGLASHGLFLFALRHLKIPTGGYVTASHNPSQHNGFKFVLNYEYFGGKQNTELCEMIQKEKFTSAEKQKGKVSSAMVLNEYCEFLNSKVKVQNNAAKKKLKVVVDCGNGMASLTAPRVLRELGCDVVELYCEVDCTFPNHPADPVVPENLRDLQSAVKKEKADFGVAFDGDGDRIVAVDEKGEVVWADQLAAVFAKHFLSKNKNAKIVFDVNCSLALPEVIIRYGGIPVASKIGHTNIERTMRQEKALMGAELSGHIFLAENNGVDDAVYAACKLVEIVSHLKESESFSSLSSDYPRYFATTQIRVPMADGKKFQFIEKMVDEFKKENYNVNDVDGAKVIFEDGWGILRASNTAAQLTMRFEGKTEQAMQRIKKLFFDKLKQHGVEVK